MLFYKVEGMIIGDCPENDDSRRVQRENARKILVKSEDFNQKRKQDAFCFVSESSDGFVTAGMINQLIARTQKLQRQIIILTYPLDAESKRKWLGV